MKKWLTRFEFRDIVVISMFAVMIWMGFQITSQQDQLGGVIHAGTARGECLGKWATQFSTALDARTSRTPQVTSAREEMDDAAAEVFRLVPPVLDPGAGPDDVVALNRALERHREAYNAVAAALQEQGEASAAYPYPDPPNICYGPYAK